MTRGSEKYIHLPRATLTPASMTSKSFPLHCVLVTLVVLSDSHSACAPFSGRMGGRRRARVGSRKERVKVREEKKTSGGKGGRKRKDERSVEGQLPPSYMASAPDCSQWMLLKIQKDGIRVNLCVNMAGPWNPDIWSNTSLVVAVKVFLDEIYI